MIKWQTALGIQNKGFIYYSRLSCTVLYALTCVSPCIIVIWEEENRLDATQWFIGLVVCSTCFGHIYAHDQELATIQLVWHVACNSWLLVVGRSGAGQQAMRPEWGMLYDSTASLSLQMGYSSGIWVSLQIFDRCIVLGMWFRVLFDA